MKELKSKKTGRVQIYSEEDFKIIASNPELLKRFVVTDLRMRSIDKITPPLEITKKKKKNEG